MFCFASFRSRVVSSTRVLPVVGAVLLSIASTGARQSQRLPADAYTAYEMFPQIAAAAEQLGHRAYTHDDGVHVEVDEDTWIYFKVWRREFRRTTQISDKLRGRDADEAQAEVDAVADDIWQLALDYRRDLKGFSDGDERRGRRSRR